MYVRKNVQFCVHVHCISLVHVYSVYTHSYCKYTFTWTVNQPLFEQTVSDTQSFLVMIFHTNIHVQWILQQYTHSEAFHIRPLSVVLILPILWYKCTVAFKCEHLINIIQLSFFLPQS